MPGQGGNQRRNLIGRWWARPTTLSDEKRKRWWVGSSAAGVLTVAAYAAQILAGDDVPRLAFWLLLVGGSFAALWAFLLPNREAAAARAKELEARGLAEKAVQNYRVDLNKVAAPPARLLAEMIVEQDLVERKVKQGQLLQLVVQVAAANIEHCNARACVFEYVAGPPRDFTYKIHGGRNSRPRGGFREGSDRGNAALNLAQERKTRFVRDVDSEHVPGWLPEGADYKTFICTPILAGDQIVGLFTIDAPAAGDLTEDDKLEAELFAHLLACGLALDSLTARETTSKDGQDTSAS